MQKTPKEQKRTQTTKRKDNKIMKTKNNPKYIHVFIFLQTLVNLLGPYDTC